MKVIITGATGVLGGPTVQYCIQNPIITGIYVLARKELPKALRSPKLTYIQIQDFSSYSPELLQQLAGAEACIWILGGSVTDLGGDYDIAREISVDWPVEAARAFTAGLRQYLLPDQKFKFVFTSMKFAEWPQNTTLYFMGDSRRLKGQAEMALIELQTKHYGELDLWCVRPSGIVPADALWLRKSISRCFNFIPAAEGGAAMVNILRRGYRDTIIENAGLLHLARDSQ